MTNLTVQTNTNELTHLIGVAGSLLAGCQTVKGNKTLKEVKPQNYVQNDSFGVWLENLVNRTIENAKLKTVLDEKERLMCIVDENQHLKTSIRDLAKTVFFEKYSSIQQQYGEKYNNMNDMPIPKLMLLADDNGIEKLERETLLNEVIKKALYDNGFK